MDNEQNILEVANQWRIDNPGHEDGVVLIWNNQAYGWKNTLRDPQHERPGVLAVTLNGLIYKAEGGNDYDGAAFWFTVNGITPTIYKLVYEYSQQSTYPVTESEQNPIAIYFSVVVKRLLADESLDASMLTKLAAAAGVSERRVPEITRFLNNWGKE